VERGDGRLGLVLAPPVLGEGGLQDLDAFCDEAGVPPSPVLLGERDDPAVRSGAAAPASVMQQHQGQEPIDLGVTHRCRELPGQPDRLGSQVDLARVALVEHEVQHPHHRRGVPGTVEARSADDSLGSTDPLRHRGLGDEVGLGDLARREPAHCPERERDRRRRREVRVRAQEVEVQAVVRARHHAGRWLGVELDLPVPASGVRSRHVDERSPGHGDQPAGGIGGRLVLPGGERTDQRLLHGVLGRREVGSATDEDAQHLGDELAELDVAHDQSVMVGGAARKGRSSSHSWIGRPPGPGAADSSPASSMARS
jgi:hypothetical protein